MIALFGSTEKESELIKIIESNFSSLTVIQFRDLHKLAEAFQSGKVDKVLLHSKYTQRVLDKKFNLLIESGITRHNIFITPINAINKYIYNGIIPTENELMVPIDEFVQIHGLNIHVADHCNLKCKACSHSAGLVQGEVFPDIRKYIKDMTRLHEVCENICSIVLLGGEPLLNPELGMFIEASRKIYAYAGIRIITNGILIKQMSEELMEIIRKYNVKISISLYPFMKDKEQEISKFLIDNNIAHEICHYDYFEKRLAGKPYFNKEYMLAACEECISLRNGSISRCVMGVYMDYYNHYFNTQFPQDFGIDLYDSKLTGKIMMDRLKKPIELCAYCSVGYKFEKIPWEQIKDEPEEKDFLVSFC